MSSTKLVYFLTLEIRPQIGIIFTYNLVANLNPQNRRALTFLTIIIIIIITIIIIIIIITITITITITIIIIIIIINQAIPNP